MSFQWLHMRIDEDRERRQREAITLENLPAALEELRSAIESCLAVFTETYGPEAAQLHASAQQLHVVVREERNGRWEQRAQVEVTSKPSLPGFHIEAGGQPMEILVGMLPDNKLFYRDGEEYLTMEELSRRMLDRALFPKLRE